MQKKKNEICAQVWAAWKAEVWPQNFTAYIGRDMVLNVAVGDEYARLKPTPREIANALDLDFEERPEGVFLFPDSVPLRDYLRKIDQDTIQHELFNLAGERVEKTLKGIAVTLRNSQWMHYIHSNPIKAVTDPGPYDKEKIETLLLAQGYYQHFKNH